MSESEYRRQVDARARQMLEAMRDRGACNSMWTAHALLDGRTNASIDDVRFIAKPVLRHRLVANFTAESEDVKTDELIDRLVQETPEAM